MPKIYCISFSYFFPYNRTVLTVGTVPVPIFKSVFNIKIKIIHKTVRYRPTIYRQKTVRYGTNTDKIHFK
jgi:hypothetical protein